MNKIRQIIKEETLKLLNETNQSITIADLKDSTELESLGLGSIDWARLLAILEIKLNSTPFQNSASVTDVSTLGEVIGAYTQSAEAKVQPPTIETTNNKAMRAVARKQARTLRENRNKNKPIDT